MIGLALTAATGLNGQNTAADVRLVRALLNVYLRSLGESALTISHAVDQALIDLIKRFQQEVMKLAKPDGLISPQGPTFNALVKFLRSRYTVQPITPPARGLLTWNAEGTEGGLYHSRILHVPSAASGLTLGRGYDMKLRSPAEVVRDLTAATVPAAAAELVSQGARLYGSAARQFIVDHDLLDFEITPAAQLALFEMIYREKEKEVIQICNRPQNRQEYGTVEWDALNPIIKDVLVDLIYRGDYTVATRRFLQKHVVNNDLAAFSAAIANAANWPNVPPARLSARAAYVRGAMAAASQIAVRGNQPWVAYA